MGALKGCTWKEEGAPWGWERGEGLGNPGQVAHGWGVLTTGWSGEEGNSRDWGFLEREIHAPPGSCFPQTVSLRTGFPARTVSSCPFLNLFSPVPKFPELPNKATQKNLPNK